jgi:predicted RNA-binding Zn ribbon-like protein
MAVSSKVPHRLDLVIDFVNTLDAEEETDALATPAGLRRWLSEKDLLEPAARSLGEAERLRAIELREALRDLLLEHNGGPAGTRAVQVLEDVARGGELGVHFAVDGSAELGPGRRGFAGALATLLVPVAEASRDGSWQRVKACRAGDCLWAFYDRSRNRSGVWCNMAVCGNRAKVRAYRQRSPGGERS